MWFFFDVEWEAWYNMNNVEVNKNMKKIWLFAMAALMAGCTGTASPAASASASATAETMTDAQKFASEYTEVSEDNVFVYRTSDEIIKILEHGTGVVYLGFPECPWCQRYVVYLNEMAKQTGISKIYYLNIMDDRNNNTEAYRKIISLIGEDNLMYDDEGNSRIYVPDVSYIVDGTVIGHDNTSSVVTEADGEPDDYWTEDRVAELQVSMDAWMRQIIKAGGCSECNVTVPSSTSSAN